MDKQKISNDIIPLSNNLMQTEIKYNFEELPSDTVEELSSESVEELPSETVDELSSESVVELPSATVDELPLETVEVLPFETVEELSSESVEELSSESVEELPLETVEVLPFETVEVLSLETVEELPFDTVEELPLETVEELPLETVEVLPLERVKDYINYNLTSIPGSYNILSNVEYEFELTDFTEEYTGLDPDYIIITELPQTNNQLLYNDDKLTNSGTKILFENIELLSVIGTENCSFKYKIHDKIYDKYSDEMEFKLDVISHVYDTSHNDMSRNDISRNDMSRNVSKSRILGFRNSLVTLSSIIAMVSLTKNYVKI
jgi:hypothetical protein